MHVAYMAVTRASSDGVAICYVLPVLQMTSCIHAMGPMGRIKHDVMFKRVYHGISWTLKIIAKVL